MTLRNEVVLIVVGLGTRELLYTFTTGTMKPYSWVSVILAVSDSLFVLTIHNVFQAHLETTVAIS